MENIQRSEEPSVPAEEQITISNVLGLRELFRGYGVRLSILVCLVFAGLLAEAFFPVGLGFAVTAIEDRSYSALYYAGLFLVLLVAMRILASVIGLNISKIIQIKTSVELKRRIGERMAVSDSVSGSGFDVGEAIETAESDTGTLALTAELFKSLIVSSLIYFVVGIYLILESWFMGSIILLVAPVLALTMPALIKRLGKRLTVHRRLASDLTSLGVDAATGLHILKGFGGGPKFLRNYYETSRHMRAAGLTVSGIRAVIEGAKVLVPMSILLLILGLGTLALENGTLSVGQLVAFFGLGLFLTAPVSSFINAVQEIAPLLVAKARFDKLMSIGDGSHKPNATTVRDLGGPLIDRVSGIEIAPGSYTAVTSTSVSSLMVIAERLGGVGGMAAGTTFIGEQDVSQLSRDQMRETVLLAEGTGYLFVGSIREALGDYPEAELWRALGVTAADDIIRSNNEAFERVLSDNGRNLSGGQRQRLSLARAILRDPPYLLLYNPTSSVDTITESVIAKRIQEARHAKTTVVFTDSPSFLSTADTVLLVNLDGIVAQGSHEELVKSSGLYRTICRREVSV